MTSLRPFLSTHQSTLLTNCNRRPWFRIHVTVIEGILGRILVSDCSILVSLYSQPWRHEVLVLSKVEMEWHTKSFDIIIPDTWLICVSLLPRVNVEIVREKPVFLVNLERKSDVVFWHWGKKKGSQCVRVYGIIVVVGCYYNSDITSCVRRVFYFLYYIVEPLFLSNAGSNTQT